MSRQPPSRDRTSSWSFGSLVVIARQSSRPRRAKLDVISAAGPALTKLSNVQPDKDGERGEKEARRKAEVSRT